MELSKTFDPKSAEEKWFQLWIERGYFTADPYRAGDAFSIVIPPPNITGQLHLGHALNITLQDIIVRTRRMQGFNTLWVPGTDHAGIATQNAVEKDLAKESKNRHQLGRDKFEERVWEWRETYGRKILHQLRRLGASCDWTRERFTLDEGLSRAVNEVFVRLYKDDLIYKDRKLINWCPRCETALSDLEVDHKDAKGHLWYIKYPFADGSGAVTVATTRPETMLGDTAVAVNPDDERFKAIVGKRIKLPLVGRDIPLIADSAVDRAFGTGAVKITPAHDFNDFDIARRHNLEQISVMDTRARMNDNAGAYRGMDREMCRRKIVEDLKTHGLLEKIEPHQHALGTCSRCDTVVEPMLSEQWFVRVKPLAEKAIAAVRDGRTKFFPKFWENTYFNWMENLHDWCISRQLWWGHRIPAYRCQRCERLMVVAARPPKCDECGGTDIMQDDDVLDTWFSSGLWPFSTLGWPAHTKDLERYYPTSLLVTGFDIIFFWVARMMMLGLWFTGEVPFRDVYITPLVRDQYGKKMTKSRGNVVDPLDLMDTYGTDALRFTLAQLSVQGRDVILSDDRLSASRAFANKIWNAARFVMMNLDVAPLPLVRPDFSRLDLADRWILSELNATIREVTKAIDAYEFNVASVVLYRFIWNRFCDWYIELSKEPLRGGGERRQHAQYVLVFCLDQLLRLLHPFMPFLTEEIWQSLKGFVPDTGLTDSIAIAPFPGEFEETLARVELEAMNICLATTEAINGLRSLLGFHPSQQLALVVITSPTELLAKRLEEWKPYAKTMTKAAEIIFLRGASSPDEVYPNKRWLPAIFGGLGAVWVEAPPDFDYTKAQARLSKRLNEVRDHLRRHTDRLTDSRFLAKADADTRAEMQQRLESLKVEAVLLQDQLEQLSFLE